MPADEYDRLIAAVQERMVNCVWRIVRDAHETDDVLQEVLMQVWTRFDEVQRHRNPTALLLCICTNRALDHLRRRKARHALLTGLVDEISSHPLTPAQQLDHHDQREQILAFIRHLPSREAEAITLHALEDLDYPEVAEAMGCSQSTVRVLMGRAREHFRTRRDFPATSQIAATNAKPKLQPD
jgi:RNA polymerase sigma-70 factor (ECF subfamily)